MHSVRMVSKPASLPASEWAFVSVSPSTAVRIGSGCLFKRSRQPNVRLRMSTTDSVDRISAADVHGCWLVQRRPSLCSSPDSTARMPAAAVSAARLHAGLLFQCPSGTVLFLRVSAGIQLARSTFPDMHSQWLDRCSAGLPAHRRSTIISMPVAAAAGIRSDSGILRECAGRPDLLFFL